MDFPSLVAANLRPRARPAKPDARAEDRYYRDHTGPPLSFGEAMHTVPAAILRRLLTMIPRGRRVAGE